jgi:hypothetical protein
MDVGDWLRGLGLGQYEQKFRDNKIDADILPRLTPDDLKEIGVSAVGDRRRLMDAIAALDGAKSYAKKPRFESKTTPSKGPLAIRRRKRTTLSAPFAPGSRSNERLESSTPGTPPRARQSSPHASASSSDWLWSMRRARFLATRRTSPRASRRRPTRAQCSSPQRQVAGLFVAEEQGAHSLKGAPVPVSLYRIIRASAAPDAAAGGRSPRSSAAKRSSGC